jgi:FAD/FMN-containing dehydrogenase/Fe-S oxidoreductase
MMSDSLTQLRLDLAAELGRATKGEVRFDPYSRALYSTDASSYQIEPLGVVIPRTRDDVQATMEIAARHKVPVLARGGGSSLAGQAIGAAVVVDFSKYMRRIVEVNAEEGWVRAEPGVVCDALNAALTRHGLMFGPDPASSNRATVGGMLANNSTGAHSVLYGMTADHVLAVEVFLSDASAAHFSALDRAALDAKLESPGHEGEIYRGLTALVAMHEAAIRERYPKTWRRASGYSLNYLVPNQSPPSALHPLPSTLQPSGYTATRPAGWYSTGPYPLASGFNLAKLMVGSEGTLAVVTEAKLNLVPRPKMTALCVAHFGSVAAAADATPVILECHPSAIELIDHVMIRLTRAIPAYARQLTFIRGDPGAILVVEFFGNSEAELIAQIEKLENHLRGRGIADTFVRAITPGEQANVWGVRKVALGILQSMKGEAKPLAFMEDVAVPVERLGEYVRTVERVFQEYGVDSAYYAHASAGCLHIRPVINLKSADGIGKMRAISAAVIDIVIAMGGAMSGEHGDGLSRSLWNGKLYGPELYGAFREVKRLFDPEGRMNPGKIVDAQDIAENMRYGADYHTREIRTHLSFADEGGFAAAVEQCNGAGVCRKADGTMCPSYMATREEEHSTRGRANALRAALSGHLPTSEFTSERMHAVLDLCLECKACKAECPSGVDMAKIKYEFLAQYQAEHGVPLRSRLFGNIHAVSRIAYRVSPIANFALASPPVRWLNEKALGIARERVLPAFAAQTFRDWYRHSHASRVTHHADGAKQVILFADTFTNFNHPEIGVAAVRVLDAAGFEVLLANHGCCGRPMISKGLLDQAKAAAARNVAALADFAERGIPIIGLEPSCLLTLRDEYLDLLPDDPRAKRVAENALLIEEFLSGLAERGELHLEWKPASGRVLVHGHCYQKSLTGTARLLNMLRLPGWEVKEIDSGCCGMAGSFGYEAEHYRVSQAIGEERLFPAVRAAEAETLIAASGMSCRHQIEGGTGRRPKHPIELLADALE